MSDVGDDVVAVPEVRGEHAVVSGEVGAWAWDQRGKAGNEVEGVEDDVSGPVTEGVLESVDDLSPFIDREDILDLGHDQPTVLVTNDTRTPKTLITRYAQRMLIENAICDAVRFFHIDALSSAVAMKVDFDMTLLVIASGLYRRLAQRMRGYAECQARQIFRDLIDMPADVTITEREVEVRFHRRAHLPIIAASGLLDEPVTVPWWNGMSLRMRV